MVLAKFTPIANVNRIVFVNKNLSANFALPASLLWFGVVLPSSYDVRCPPRPIGLRLVIGRL